MGDGVAYQAMGRLLASLPSERERKIEAILDAVFNEPIFKKVSWGPFMERVAQNSGLPLEEVQRLIESKKPKDPQGSSQV